MKKYMIFFLLLAGQGTALRAQNNSYNFYENIFDSPKPGKGNGLFGFFYEKRLAVMMEATYISQVNYLPNLDSLLQQTVQLLQPLKDSLMADGIVRRVDVVYGNTAPLIRIISHPEFSNAFTVKDNELMQLKVNYDTVRIVFYTRVRREPAYTENAGNGAVDQAATYPFVITLFINNVADIANIPPDRLSQCLATLRPKVERYSKKDNNYAGVMNYRAQFNMNTGQMFSPFNASYIPTGEHGLSGVIGFGLHAVRGTFAPYLEAGFEFGKSNAYFTNRFRASLELQNFFSRDAAGKLNLYNNVFADFQYRQTPRSFSDNKLRWIPNISLGYLIKRQGDWYEKNTFRLGLPQLAGKNLSLTPYVVFNDFFKNVSIGLKFGMNF